MKKQMKKQIYFLPCLMMVVILAACGSFESKIAGTWYVQSTGEYLAFGEDGTARKYDSWGHVSVGTYSIEKETLELMIGSTSESYNYTLEDEQLILYPEGSASGTIYSNVSKGEKQ